MHWQLLDLRKHCAGRHSGNRPESVEEKKTKGQPLFLQGDPADEVFLIKGGRIKLTKVLEDGTGLLLDIRKAGDFAGENMFSEEG